MKNKILKTSLMFGVLLFAFLVYKIGLKQIYEYIKYITLIKFLILLLLNFIGWILCTYTWKIVLSQYDGEISFLNLFAARMAGHSISYLTPSAYLGGEPIRAMMVKGSDIRKSAASVIVDKTIHVFTMIIFIIIGIIIAIAKIALWRELKIVFIAFLFGSVIFTVFVFIKQTQGFLMWIVRSLERIKIKIRFFATHKEKIEEIDGYVSDFYRKHKRAFLIVFVLNCLLGVYWVGEIYLTLLFMQAKEFSFLTSFLIMTLGNLSILVPTIPASLGTYETAHVIIFVLVGLGAAAGLTLTIIRRIIALIWTGVGLLVIGAVRK